MKFFFHDLWSFLRCPRDQQLKPRSTLQSLTALLFSFMLLLLMKSIHSFGLMPIVGYFYQFNGVAHDNANPFLGQTAWQVFLFMVLLAPLAEEVLFRLQLNFRFNPILALGRNDENRLRRRAWWDRNFGYIFYATALAFGVVHLSNWNQGPGLWLWLPLVCFGHFSSGVLMGFLRVRQGFFWGFALHFCINLFAFCGAMLTRPPLQLANETEVVRPRVISEVSNDQYQLEIKETPTDVGPSFDISMKVDTITFRHAKLDLVFASLLGESTSHGTQVSSFPPEMLTFCLDVELIRRGTMAPLDSILLSEIESHYGLSVLFNQTEAFDKEGFVGFDDELRDFPDSIDHFMVVRKE